MVTRLLMSKYFGFRFFKAKLISIEELMPINLVNGLCILVQCVPAVISSVAMAYYDDTRE